MVNTAPAPVRPRRRLSVEARRDELLQACREIIGTQPWDEVSMADVAAAAGASKPLLYHYFSTKSDLYLAAIRSAAAELREATKPDPALAINDQLITALRAHVDWIDVNAPSYRAVLHGGISSDPVVQAIVEESRAAVVSRLAEAFGYDTLSAVQRTVFRGWVGFLEGACLEWLAARDLSKAQLVDMLAASVFGAIRVAEVAAGDTADPNGLTSSND